MNVDVRKLKSLMTYHEVTTKSLAKSLDMTEATLRSRFRNPGNFSIDEMNNIIKILNIPNPEEIFYPNYS